MIGELFSKYQLWYETHVSNDSNSVLSIVEVSGVCQSVNIYCMSAPTRDCYSEMICILRKIHRLRKHPWIPAQTMDP